MLKSKFPFQEGGVNRRLTFDGEFKFAKIKKNFYKGFFKKFLSFRAKKCAGMRWPARIQVLLLYKVQGEP